MSTLLPHKVLGLIMCQLVFKSQPIIGYLEVLKLIVKKCGKGIAERQDAHRTKPVYFAAQEGEQKCIFRCGTKKALVYSYVCDNKMILFICWEFKVLSYNTHCIFPRQNKDLKLFGQ